MSRPTRISAATLKGWLDSPQSNPKIVIIDVRDDDRFGVSIVPQTVR